MEKIAVISDIHGNILALEVVVNDLERRHVDGVLNLGDHVSGPLWPRDTLDYLKRQDWIHIRGNHDRQLIAQPPAEQGLSDLYASQFLQDDDREWLKTLPASAEIHDRIVLCHGSPTNDQLYLLETIEHGRVRAATPGEIRTRLGDVNPQIILCGHSHVPRVVTLPDGLLMVNPGSVGLPAYDDQEPEPHVIETGSPHARYAILENRPGGWIIDLVAVVYEHRKAADQALKNQRPDWALALQTGYMSR